MTVPLSGCDDMGDLINLAEWRKRKEEEEKQEEFDELDDMEDLLKSLMRNIGIPIEYHPQYAAYIVDEEGEMIPLTLDSKPEHVDEDDKAPTDRSNDPPER